MLTFNKKLKWILIRNASNAHSYYFCLMQSTYLALNYFLYLDRLNELKLYQKTTLMKEYQEPLFDPVEVSKRIVSIDILRGIAVFGIFRAMQKMRRASSQKNRSRKCSAQRCYWNTFFYSMRQLPNQSALAA